MSLVESSPRNCSAFIDRIGRRHWGVAAASKQQRRDQAVPKELSLGLTNERSTITFHV